MFLPISIVSGRSLRHRRLQPELMDDPEIDPRLHAAALRGLNRINAASRTAPSLWRAIRKATGVRRGDRLRVLDVACGGGDVARGLWRHGRRAGVALSLHGVDISPTAVERARAHTPPGTAVSYSVADALQGPLPFDFDVVTCTLFLHHLPEADAARLLKQLAQAARVAVIVSDLRRSTAGYWLAQAACRTLTRSPIVHVDGPRSVEGAFTIEEFRQLANEAGLHGVRVGRQWPQRLLAVWRRES
ncbi:Ubiquinone biosynthesis O-methyltransferase [Pirellulimonas nuda]|uniref:Ubiquinone biosynthesis O-methyltransferase n=1 Tax=Pirellulimonas nuda TaxID=2528009 RepID=A0A518D9Z0_9BACT|nr:methyltransferase domain-containing protein [Pirellulimonas nuda]QDU88246.1 Ubiquinone biosynthesis O-methyltransferase [Pirellulimonas nuda]